MGILTPNIPLVYEKIDGITFAIRADDPSNREAVGWSYDPRTADGRPLYEHLQESKLWGEIHREAKTNPALQKALERAKIIYYLSKEDKNEKQ